MSYLVLARKYRPRNFREMVGQEHVVQALSHALTQQRLHHAYLFTGTRGVGKTTVSRILAKSLNCQGADGQGGITAEPCGVCQACTDIDAGRFVDYTELDAASNRGVDEVQQLLEQAVYKPVQGRFKVFMIDEVHMLTGHAFNAMLKTLEEPPEYLKFVLATTDPQKVPVTVLSRCLQFNLRPMAPETVQEHLGRVLEVESIPAEAGALRLLGRAARGSMRDALSLTDQAIAFGGGRIEEAAVRQMLGSVDRSHVFRLIEALAASDGASVVEACEGLRSLGLSAGSTLEEMTAVLQRMAVVQAVPAAADTQDEEGRRIAELAGLHDCLDLLSVGKQLLELARRGGDGERLAHQYRASLTARLSVLTSSAKGGGGSGAGGSVVLGGAGLSVAATWMAPRMRSARGLRASAGSGTGAGRGPRSTGCGVTGRGAGTSRASSARRSRRLGTSTLGVLARAGAVRGSGASGWARWTAVTAARNRSRSIATGAGTGITSGWIRTGSAGSGSCSAGSVSGSTARDAAIRSTTGAGASCPVRIPH